MPKVAVHGAIRIVPARLEEFKTIFAKLIEASQKETGTETYIATVKEDDPCAFRVFEVYASDDAYAAHLNSPNFGAVKKFAESGGLAGPLDVEKHALL